MMRGVGEETSPSSATSSPTTFSSIGAATSLKERIIEKLPEINDAAQFRQVREILRTELGGTGSLRDELVFAGIVDPKTNLLTTNEKPFNVFARITSGQLVQSGMDHEQLALDTANREKFKICCNQATHNLHWDSSDPNWVGKASMSRRHRFLCSKDLHWQWFNALVFGLVGEKHGGTGIAAAVAYVQSMKQAALQYAKNVGGWSDQVGLFVNVFGHNSVNSLFVHIVDLAETGPSAKALAYKNLPLDDVIKVLLEEAANAQVKGNDMRTMSTAAEEVDAEKEKTRKQRAFFFAGTDGATSLKQEITGRIPVLRDAAAYREARRLLLEELGGPSALKEELSRAGFVSRETEKLTTGTSPFNIFARVASGVMEQPGMAQENAALGQYGDRFCICRNLPVNDEHWDSEDPQWIGKASMSRRHRFLTTRDLHWRWFNALCFGLVPAPKDDESSASDGGGTRQRLQTAQEEAAIDTKCLQAAVDEVEAMKAAAVLYTKNMGGWSQRVGLFFHVFGHNSVNSLHLHIVDLEETGPSFTKQNCKNVPLESVLKVLKEESAIATISEVTRFEDDPALAATMLVGRTASTRRRVTEKMAVMNWNGDSEVVEMNIGGEFMLQVCKATLLLVPQDSLMYKLFANEHSPHFLQDANGRIFLDFPPASFKRIVDHLRLLQLAPPDRLVPPPVLSSTEEHEFRILASILGIEEFLMAKPQQGRGGVYSSSPIRSTHEGF